MKPFISNDNAVLADWKDKPNRKIKLPFLIKTNDLSGNYQLVSIKNRISNSDDNEVIYQKHENYLIIEATNEKVTTGNWIGWIYYNILQFQITSRFGDNIIIRMLNFANDIFLNNIDSFNSEHVENPFYFITIYQFTKYLEKAILNGLPAEYAYVRQKNIQFKGKVDLANHIKNDVPYQGKLSCIVRERKVVRDIINVLYHAQTIVKDSVNILPKISSALAENSSSNFTLEHTQQIAINHRILANPIYKDYKEALKWAIYIIKSRGVDFNDKSRTKNALAYLFNVAELFEIYVLKLLKNNFTEWEVESPKILLYENNFFKRKIIPDIVMKKDNTVLVFDVKYKRMNYQGVTHYSMGDLDREDFFQINTYMTYYQNQGYKVLAGGLIYPLEKQVDIKKCYSEHWFGNDKTKFIVDGIEIPKDNRKTNKNRDLEIREWLSEIEKKERQFLERIRKLAEVSPIT